MLNNKIPILSVIVPVYNNEDTISELASRIDQVCQNCCEGNYELLFIDDGSSDKSWSTISSLQSEKIRGLRFSRNFGQHAALKAGFAHSRGKFLVMMDADLDDDPELIDPILNKLKNGVEICFTIETATKQHSVRLTSKIFHKLTNQKHPVLTNKIPSTMRGFSDKVLNAILKYQERRPVYGPLITGLGFKQGYIERPSLVKRSTSSYSFKKRLRLAVDYLIGYTNIPSVFFIFASFLAFFGSLIYSSIILFQYYFLGEKLPPGLSLIALLLLVLFATLYLGIGIIGIYLQRLLNESLNRPLYLISETTGDNSQRYSSKPNENSLLGVEPNARRD